MSEISNQTVKCYDAKAAAVQKMSSVTSLLITQRCIIKNMKMSLNVTGGVRNSPRMQSFCFKAQSDTWLLKPVSPPPQTFQTTCRYTFNSLLIFAYPHFTFSRFFHYFDSHRPQQHTYRGNMRKKAPQWGLVRHRQLSSPLPQSHIKGFCSLRRKGKKKCLNVLSILITDKTRLWRDHALKHTAYLPSAHANSNGFTAVLWQCWKLHPWGSFKWQTHTWYMSVRRKTDSFSFN